jgi:hypothetical protein
LARSGAPSEISRHQRRACGKLMDKYDIDATSGSPSPYPSLLQAAQASSPSKRPQSNRMPVKATGINEVVVAVCYRIDLLGIVANRSNRSVSELRSSCREPLSFPGLPPAEQAREPSKHPSLPNAAFPGTSHYFHCPSRISRSISLPPEVVVKQVVVVEADPLRRMIRHASPCEPASSCR